jgi:hypothetical protein
MLGGTLVLGLAAASAPIVVLLVGYVLIGSGAGLLNTPITDAAVAGLPPERAGVAGAVTSTFRQVGNSLGVALLGTLTFAGFARRLPTDVAKLHLSPAATSRALSAARGAGARGGLAGLTGQPSAVGGAIERAFVSGLHEAYFAAAGFALLTVLVALATFRRTSG